MNKIPIIVFILLFFGLFWFSGANTIISKPSDHNRNIIIAVYWTMVALLFFFDYIPL